MALTQVESGGIKDDAVIASKVAADAIVIADLAATGTASSSTFLRGDNSWVTPTDTNTQLSTEEVQDIVGGMFTGNTETNITATYEDGDGTIDLVASAGVGGATGVDFNDNVKVTLGTGDDATLFHDGNNTIIRNETGNLRIEPKNSELGIRAVPDGTVELYYDNAKKFETITDGVKFDGILHWDSGNTGRAIELLDNQKIFLGTGTDLQIYHDGNNSVIKHGGTGDLIVQSLRKIYLRPAEGEEGVTANANGSVDLYYDNAKKLETIATGVVITGSDDGDGGAKGDFKFFQVDGTSKVMFDASAAALEFADSAKATFGAGDDLQIYHDATNSHIDNNTGELRINSASAIKLYHNDTLLYYTESDRLRCGDNISLAFGNASDLRIYHDGSNSYIQHGTVGNLRYQSGNHDFYNQAGDEYICRMFQDNAVYLYYDGNKKFETGSGGIAVTGYVNLLADGTNSGGSLYLPDSNGTTSKINVGTGNDLQIYHDGNNSYISDTGTGSLIFKSSRLSINATDGTEWGRWEGGYLYVGTTSEPSGGDDGVMMGAGGYHSFARNTSASTVFRAFGSGGEFRTIGSGNALNTNNSYGSISDRVLKENEVDASSQWNDIKALKIKNYNLKSKPGEKHLGVIAQDLEASGISGLVENNADELYTSNDVLPEGKNIGDVKLKNYKTVKYSILYMKAVKALQEAIAKIETLETKVAALEAG